MTSDYRYTYILECLDSTWYTGWAKNLSDRIGYHRQGMGAKYTKSHGVRDLVCAFVVADKSTAMKLECAIKKLTRKQKESLVKNSIANNPEKILDFDVIAILTEVKNYDGA